MLTGTEYVKNSGTCPKCGGVRPRRPISVNIDGGGASQRICCLTCEFVWYDAYALTGYSYEDAEGFHDCQGVPVCVVFVKDGIVDEVQSADPLRVILVDGDTDGREDVTDLPGGGEGVVYDFPALELPDQVVVFSKLADEQTAKYREEAKA